jgi:hypothetical protein
VLYAEAQARVPLPGSSEHSNIKCMTFAKNQPNFR